MRNILLIALCILFSQCRLDSKSDVHNSNIKVISDSNLIYNFFDQPDLREKYLVIGSPNTDNILKNNIPLKFNYNHLEFRNHDIESDLDSIILKKEKDNYIVEHFIFITGSNLDFFPYLTSNGDTLILHRPEFNSGYIEIINNDTLISSVASAAPMKFSFYIPYEQTKSKRYIEFQNNLLELK